MRSGTVVIDKRGNIGSVLGVDATYPEAWVFVELDDIPGAALQYRETEIRELPESTAVEYSRIIARREATAGCLSGWSQSRWSVYCDVFNSELFYRLT